MQLTYEKKAAMTLIGYHTEIQPEDGCQKCPEFWDRQYAARFSRLFQTMKPETPLEEAVLANGIGQFSICADSENGFTYWIAGLYTGGEVPEGLELFTFPESWWAVFSTKGPMPHTIQNLNTYVWEEWFPTEGKKHQANGSATLEVYSDGNPQSPDYESGIWVPVKEYREGAFHENTCH